MSEQTIGQRIYELRKKRGLTLEQVGDAVGVGKSTVRKWETGAIASMRQDKILGLANILQTTPAYLMGRTGLVVGEKARKSVAHNLVSAREKAKLTLTEAAQQAGVTAEQLEQIETGAVPLSETMLIRLCAVYDVRPERIQVLDDEQQEERYEMRQLDEQIAEYRRQLQKEQPAEPNLDELSPTKRYLIDAINRLPEDQLQVLAAVIDQVMHGRGE